MRMLRPFAILLAVLGLTGCNTWAGMQRGFERDVDEFAALMDRVNDRIP